MSYTVLARRYRSQVFDEVVGQDAVARTLKNALEQNRVAHAYLFVGTRGVGKTTMARILAKALSGGSPEVDKAIMTGQDTDVIEIDAASNNSVDNARDLIANSIYRPLRGKAKVYIIDEVHMLSTQAFNALLKTLEEPPEHVKFILCTTEAQKVPATIRSRCQRFDFRTLSTAEIAAHLKQVAGSENAKAEPDLLHTVARLAQGSMRDALSLLDRLMAAAKPGESMTVAMLEDLVGLPAREAVSSLVDSLASGDAPAALSLVDRMLTSGTPIDQVIETLIDRLRDLMILSVCGSDTDLVDISGEFRAQSAAQASRFDGAGLIHMIALCESVQRNLRNSVAPRALLDALIVRLAMTEKIADIATLLASPGSTRAIAARASPPPPPPSTATAGERRAVGAGPSKKA